MEYKIDSEPTHTMNLEPFNDLSWNDDPLHSPNRTTYIERLRARVKELEAERNETQGNVCSFCNWANVGTLNIGDPNETSVWICHGCVKRQYAKLTALEKEVARLSEYLERHQEEIARLTKERDQLKGEVADALWLLENIWMDMKGHNSVDVFRRRDAWLAKNPTPHDATERQKE